MNVPEKPTQVSPDDGFVLLHDLVVEARMLDLTLARARAQVVADPVLGPSHRELLKAVEANGPQTVPQLARKRGTSRQNIQALVNRLTVTGSIVLVRNPNHRKSSLVKLTDLGNRLLANTRSMERQLLA